MWEKADIVGHMQRRYKHQKEDSSLLPRSSFNKTILQHTQKGSKWMK